MYELVMTRGVVGTLTAPVKAAVRGPLNGQVRGGCPLLLPPGNGGCWEGGGNTADA